MTPAQTPTSLLERRAVVRDLLSDRAAGLIVVSGLGSSTWDVAAAGDDPLNFYLNGAMGSACPLGLGLALAQPSRRVLVITGDGELLMSLGVLATIGVTAPPNLAIVVLDNERYGETGNQPTHTAKGVDLAAVATACGFPSSATVRTSEELAGARHDVLHGRGPIFVAVKVAEERLPLVLPPLDAAYVKHRMRERLTGRP